MRLGSTTDEKEFAKWLIEVGHGQHTEPDGSIKLPQHTKCGDTVDALINSSYPHIGIINSNDGNDQYFLERTILTSRNDDVTNLNYKILQKMPGQELLFQSADSVITEQGADGDFQYPLEYLNSIEMGGLPLAKLRLKIGAPIMILRNLDPAHGICNGTRAVLTRASHRVLEVRILGGEHAGHTAFIPRITITPSNGELPFQLRRRQSPVQLAFAMTINKAQGQSVKNVGLHLQKSVFTHGQLYVALSQCTSSQRIKVIFKEGTQETVTRNIVYPEVLI